MSLGGGEILIIVVLALLLFGPDKLPELARTVARGMREIRRATDEVKSHFDLLAEEEPSRPVRPATRRPSRTAEEPATSDEVDSTSVWYDGDSETQDTTNVAASDDNGNDWHHHEEHHADANNGFAVTEYSPTAEPVEDNPYNLPVLDTPSNTVTRGRTAGNSSSRFASTAGETPAEPTEH